MPGVEVLCPQLCPEVIGVTIQVSSPRYWCRLARSRQMHEDVGVALFADHIGALTEL